jgi:esterase/lipase superfamily enzyme
LDVSPFATARRSHVALIELCGNGVVGCAVVFASPDIDMDVFSSSIERIGPLASKISVIISTNDRALAVSSWIAGGISRGGVAEQADLKRQGLHVIDASKQGWGIINHDLFLSNAQIRQVIRRAIDGQRTLA